MERAGFEHLKAQLLTLTPKQRQQAQALLGSTPEPEHGVVGNQILLWDTLRDVWSESLRGANLAPLAVIKERLSVELDTATLACDALINEHLPNIKRTERAACYRLFARVTIEYVRAVLPQAALGAKSLLQQLANVALHMDNAFPGYGQAHLLGLVFRRLIEAPDTFREPAHI
jgi:hypothetical protein